MKLTLSGREQVAEGTMSFLLTPERALRFAPGQFGEFTLTDPPHEDSKGNTRTLSLASSPNDHDIMIAMRMRDTAFKNSLREVPLGTTVDMMGPMGGLTLHKDSKRPAVFLTGGIGITPVRSIAKHATEERLPHEIVVLYSNRTRALTAFLGDFEAWRRTNPNLSFVPTLTDDEPSDWPFELGFIDEAMVRRHVSDLKAPIYYVVGPPGMVAAMRELLERAGVDEMQVKTEDFAGY